MTEIVINNCHGGFGLSRACVEALGLTWKVAGSFGYVDADTDTNEFRTNPELIAYIKTYGSEAASGRYAELRIVEIPDGVDWRIGEYDGAEWVAEVHRVWYATD